MRPVVILVFALAVWAYPAGTTAQQARVDHAAQGRVAFEAGRYRDALDHFQRAYEQTGAPIVLYNIGQAADRLRLDATTLRAFSLYLQRYPDAPNRDEVRHRMNALRPLVDMQAKALAAERARLGTSRDGHGDDDVIATLLPSPYAMPRGSQSLAASDAAGAATASRKPLATINPWVWVAVSVIVMSSVTTAVVVASQ